jgi:predicted TIM-barrel fold metal-dependent hydrolase
MMQLVDSQIHLWLDDEAAKKMLQTYMSAEDVLAEMNHVGVERTYLVPGHSAANDICVETARRWPTRFCAFALLALDKPQSQAILKNWTLSGFSGVRLAFPPYRKISWLDDGTAEWFWPLANELSLPVMIWAPLRTQAISDLAIRFPQIRFIIDHVNLHVLDKGESVEKAVEGVLSLVKLPNLAVKLTSLPAHSSCQYPFKDMHHFVHKVVQAFGADRCLWGTDLTRRTCSYEQAISMFTKEMAFLNQDALKEIMGGSALRWLGWNKE